MVTTVVPFELMTMVPPLMLMSPSEERPFDVLPEWVMLMEPPVTFSVPSLLMPLPSNAEEVMVMSAVPLTVTSVSDEMPLESLPLTLRVCVPPLMAMASLALMPLPLWLDVGSVMWEVPPEM